MYGKIFESLFTGSMVGSGSHIFAVWSYVIANTKPDSSVELNPIILAAILGEPPERIGAAIAFLLAPDARSRSKVEDGRRLVQEGEFLYSVPTYEHYHNVRTNEERREYFRDKKREQRRKTKMSNCLSKTVKDMSPVSTYTDTDTDTEEEKNTLEASVSPLASKLAAQIVAAWNSFENLPKVRNVSSSRAKGIATRLKDKFFAENWEQVIAKISASDFCTGRVVGQNPWLASFDWLIKPDTAVRVMEGKYDNRGGKKAGPSDNAMTTEEMGIVRQF